MSASLENILEKGNHIPDDVLQLYLEGKLSSNESHQLEKHLLDCELCSDSLEAMKMMQSTGFQETVSGLKKKIDARIESANGKGKLISLKPYYGIAAVIALLILFGGGYWFLKDDQQNKMIAENPAPKTSVNNDSAPVQLIPQNNSGEQTAPAVSMKPSFSVPENKSTSAPTTIKSNNQVAGNDTYRDKNEDLKQPDDDSQTKKLSETSEAKETKEQEAPAAGSSAADQIQSTKSVPAETERAANYEIAKAKEPDSKRESIAAYPNELFARGKANYDQKKYPEAENDFEKLMNDSTTNFYDDAKWFLANSYLRNHKSAKALKLLREISNSKSLHRKQAEDLLKESQ